MTTTRTTITVSGTRLSLHPTLSTRYPQPDDCALTYRRPDGALLAWDVVYGLSFSSEARTCHPPEVTDWWFQSEPAATYTAFGPEFECPEAYHAVQTALVPGEDGVQQVFCCPSSFSLLAPQPLTNAWPSQCISTATPGQALSFLDIDFPNGKLSTTSTTSTVDDDDVTVYGQPVNGFRVEASATGSAEGADDSAGGDEGAPDSAGGSGTPKGVIVGASVGAVAGLGLILLGAWLLWRRRRHPAIDAGTVEELDGRAVFRPGMGKEAVAKLEQPAHCANAGYPARVEPSVVYELPGPGRNS